MSKHLKVKVYGTEAVIALIPDWAPKPTLLDTIKIEGVVRDVREVQYLIKNQALVDIIVWVEPQRLSL